MRCFIVSVRSVENFIAKLLCWKTLRGPMRGSGSVDEYSAAHHSSYDLILMEETFVVFHIPRIASTYIPIHTYVDRY